MDAPPQRRLAPLLLAAFALLVGLFAAGVWLGGHPEHVPSFLRPAFVENHETLVVDEAIDRIAHDYYRPVGKRQLSNASIAGVVASLNDRFSHYLNPRELREFNSPVSFTGIGVEVNADKRGLRIAHVFDASPAARAGLAPGEVIVAVDGRKLAGVSADAARDLIRGRPGTDVVLAVEPSAPRRAPTAHGAAPKTGVAARPRTVRVTRATISEPVVASTTRTVHGVKLGVVALAMFSEGAHAEVRAAVERELRAGARGIVLDLRGNGGGLVEEARLVASIFVRSGTIVTTRGRTQPTQTLTATGGAIAASIPLVVLVDANTASAAEIVAAALQDHHRASVVGTHTFGKGVFQEEEPLGNGGALDITVGEYFTPAGRNLGGGGVKRGAGIAPEVVVKHGVDGTAGLNAALEALAAKAK